MTWGDQFATWFRRDRQAVTDPEAPLTAGWLLALLAVIEVTVQGFGHSADLRRGLALAVVAAATTVPLAVLRPLAAAVILTVASALSLGLFDTLTVAGAVAMLIAMYRLGRRSFRFAPLAPALPFGVILLADAPGPPLQDLALVLAAATPATALAGVVVRIQREAAEHLKARDAIAGSLVEHTARGERARISRELHDVVAHNISMIAVQAETARLTTPGLSAEGQERFASIGDTARQALNEMRRLLGVLREDIDAEPVDLAPQPSLRELNQLLDSARDAAGSGTRLILSGRPIALDPGVELTAYRIVQEAVTNVRRHAPGAAVDVELRYDDECLHVRIRDNGPGPAPGRADGHGLLGMRERAAAVGGELQTGAAVGGGFLVTASLPGKDEEGG